MKTDLKSFAAMSWHMVKVITRAALWDLARALGFPAYVDPASGDPGRSAVAQQIEMYIQDIARSLSLRWQPREGIFFGVKLILGELCRMRAQEAENRVLHERIQELAGMRMSRKMAAKYIEWCAEQSAQDAEHKLRKTTEGAQL